MNRFQPPEPNPHSGDDKPRRVPEFDALTEITLSPSASDKYHPELFFGSEGGSQSAIARVTVCAMKNQGLSEYNLLERARDEREKLVDSLRRQNSQNETVLAELDSLPDLTQEDISDFLAGNIDLSDPLMITVMEHVLKIRLAHL